MVYGSILGMLPRSIKVWLKGDFMQTLQDRILKLIEKRLTENGYSLSISYDYANTGRLYVSENAASTEAIAQITFNFQGDTYTLSLTVRGVRIPSQVGRADYFNFYQSYNKPTRFWDVLAEHLPALPKPEPLAAQQEQPISQDSAISVKSFLESISLADTPYNDYESDRLDLIETLEMLIRVRPQWETQARLEREKLARLVIKKYEGTFAVPFEDCEMLDLALQIVGDKPADHGNDFAEGLDKRIAGTDREAFDKAHASLKCQLFSEDTLHVEVPEAINAEAFNDAVSGFCDATGYYDLDESGLLIDAADLEGMIESEAEDKAIADFLIQVRLVVQDADYIYFHRELRCRPNAGGKKQNHGELLADGSCRDCGVVPPPKQL